MAAIELVGVSKRFGAMPVVDAIDLRIEEGEFFTFVGPSGCGKSTLLSLIAGLERPSAGTIRIGDRVANDLEPRERDVAMVFQSYALYPHMTVAQNIGFPLALRGQTREDIAAAVARTARSLGIESLLERRPRELSGGQRQRVALGRTLVRRPQAFLMDEPLSNLDARLRLEMRAELKRLHADHHTTTVYVTHDQEEAMALSDRVAVLHAGRVQQCGAPMQVYDDPANMFVAGFIGSPPMNFFEAALLDDLLAPPLSVSTGVMAGVRPVDVAVAVADGDASVSGRVILSEPTGSDVWVLVSWRGQRVLARARADQVFEIDAEVRLDFPRERIYLFDCASGERRREATR
jgi:multiple sugar transport system ATP-binding protein